MGFVDRLRKRCELCAHDVMCSQFAFYIQSIGFALLLIGINYLIFQERLLGERAADVEKYVNEAVGNAVALNLSSFFPMIRPCERNTTATLCSCSPCMSPWVCAVGTIRSHILVTAFERKNSICRLESRCTCIASQSIASGRK